MKEEIEKECVVHFINQPPKEQLLFLINLSIDEFIEEKYKEYIEKNE